METSIGLSEDTKKQLDELKIHPNQSYEEVILLLLSTYKKAGKVKKNGN